MSQPSTHYQYNIREDVSMIEDNMPRYVSSGHFPVLASLPQDFSFGGCLDQEIKKNGEDLLTH
jgi:hypothetical protein